MQHAHFKRLYNYEEDWRRWMCFTVLSLHLELDPSDISNPEAGGCFLPHLQLESKHSWAAVTRFCIEVAVSFRVELEGSI